MKIYIQLYSHTHTLAHRRTHAHTQVQAQTRTHTQGSKYGQSVCPRYAKMYTDKSNVHTWLSGGQVGPTFFDCNLKLGLLKSRRDSWHCDTSHADQGWVQLHKITSITITITLKYQLQLQLHHHNVILNYNYNYTMFISITITAPFLHKLPFYLWNCGIIGFRCFPCGSISCVGQLN